MAQSVQWENLLRPQSQHKEKPLWSNPSLRLWRPCDGWSKLAQLPSEMVDSRLVRDPVSENRQTVLLRDNF